MDSLFGAWRMMVFSGFWQSRMRFFALLASAFVAWSGRALAADPPPRGSSSGRQDAVKIEPYKGPPIFLAEPEKLAVTPTIVTRETVKDKLGDGRVEREVA